VIDLHTHSTASDGTLAPEALIDLAAERKLTALALTDHDTVAGLPAALAQGKKRGLEVVPGVELGIQWNGAGQMHLLGYFFRAEDAGLSERLRWLRDRRRERAQRIVEKLKAAGVALSFERVEQIAGGEAIGRPHVARALMEAGVVASIGEAFGRFLSPGRPGYEDKDELTPEQAIQLIRAAGGVAVLAHPGTLKLAGAALENCLKELMGHGLAGLEAIWSSHSAEQVRDYKALAEKMGLLTTGGSDFHGENKPDIQLGTGRRGNVQVPDSVLTALRQRCQARPASGSD
jgi:hypothetical protein